MSEADYLALQQWLSPAFPVGGFAWSHGLETAIAQGFVADAGSLEDWLKLVIGRGSGLLDATLLVAAMDPNANFETIDAKAKAFAGSSERLAETKAQGEAFVLAHNALTERELLPVALPVAVGRAAQDLGLTPVSVAAHYLQAFAANLVSAAVRLVPLGAVEGQSTLQALRPTILDTAETASKASVETLAMSQPGADFQALRHETQDVRLFRS
ncbi:MAG: urease accessory UreF family protein [Pseudomonadota bacterium]